MNKYKFKSKTGVRDLKLDILKTGVPEGYSRTRFDVNETLCPQQNEQMLVHKGGQIKNWSEECRDIIPTKLQCQAI